MSRAILVSTLLAACFASLAPAADGVLSHPPMRPLAGPSKRPQARGPASFVDGSKGDDRNDGSREKPWKTVNHAVARLAAGDTLYLRGGVYHEHVKVTAQGKPGSPITVRSHPGELAILDGGLPEFLRTPATAWEPAPGGVPGEFRSVKVYPHLDGKPAQTNLLGNFADSMVPLHGYRFLSDLRSDNVYFNLPKNTSQDDRGIYCGPGLFLDSATGRIHVRLGPTRMKYLADGDNYSGPTDPRKLPLVVAGFAGGSTLSLVGARHVRVQDLAVRGARAATILVERCQAIEFDGLTVHGGSSCFQIRETAGLRILHTACRGIAAPWTFRGSLKYRAIESRIVSASGWVPTPRPNRDFELAYSEFTDSVDGVFIGNVQGVRFHHCLLDNVSDDGVFLTSGTGYDGTTPGGEVFVYQNLFSRCLTTFAFGVGHGRQKALPTGLQTGSGVHVYRNVFDFRRPVHYHQPVSPGAAQEVRSKGRFAGDHGSPAWEPMRIYHNTIVADDAPRYTYGTWGLGNAIGRGTSRRIFNNVVVQLESLPGATFPPAATDLQVDGNLHWSVAQGPAHEGDLFGRFRASKAFADSKARYAPGWGARDRFADPKFVAFSADWKKALDLRPRADSPCVDAGVAIPADWPDPLRGMDRGSPDIGAMPLNAEPWHVGVGGRISACGEEKAAKTVLALESMRFPERKETHRPVAHRPAAIVEGYPARDVPLVTFALERQGVPVEVRTRRWLDTREYPRYGLVVVAANLTRAKIEPDRYSEADLERVQDYLTKGGTLLVMLSGKDVFRTPLGQKYLTGWTGTAGAAKEGKLDIRMADHAWLRHLDARKAHPWISAAGRMKRGALGASKGERLIATPEGHAILYRVAVGKGSLIYVGWEIADSLPQTRKSVPTLEQERGFEEQMQVLFALVATVYPGAGGRVGE